MSVEATPIGAVSRIGPVRELRPYAIDDGESLLLFDPLGVPGAIARSSPAITLVDFGNGVNEVVGAIRNSL